MAYIRSTRVDPRDLRKNTAIGVKLPFNAGGVFYSVFSTTEQLKYNLINLLLTAKGERVENPNFGTTLKAQLFEQIDPSSFSDIQESITESVQTYIPEIKINKIDFIPDTDLNTLLVTITYQILISGQTDTVTVNFE